MYRMSKLDIENPVMENGIYSIEELETMISESQKKLGMAHKMLMEDENTQEEQKRLEEELKVLNNQVFRFQSQLRKRYTEEFSKSTDTR